MLWSSNSINWICGTRHLRVRQPARERRLLASLADIGQQMPIVVVHGAAPYVVVDGYKRVRCLRRLHRDTVAAVQWDLSETDALILRQLLQTEATDSVFEQGWLLRTLREDHGLALERAGAAVRSQRELGVAAPRPGAHATGPGPAARARGADGRPCRDEVPRAVGARQAGGLHALADALAPHRFTTRQIGRLYQAYVAGPAATQDLVLTNPVLVLRLTEDTRRPRASARKPRPRTRCITDLHVLGAVARRATRRLQHGAACSAGARPRLAASSPGPAGLPRSPTTLRAGAAR